MRRLRDVMGNLLLLLVCLGARKEVLGQDTQTFPSDTVQLASQITGIMTAEATISDLSQSIFPQMPASSTQLTPSQLAAQQQVLTVLAAGSQQSARQPAEQRLMQAGDISTSGSTGGGGGRSRNAALGRKAGASVSGAANFAASSPGDSDQTEAAAVQALIASAGGNATTAQPPSAGARRGSVVVKNTEEQTEAQAAVKDAALNRDHLKAQALAGTVVSSRKPPILLIHGGAQGGWVWSYPNPQANASRGVMGFLEDAGYLVYNPTLPYHEPGTKWSPSQGMLTAQDYVSYIIQFMETENISNAVVVGHSVAGVWLQLLLGQAADRISSVVFLNAIVLKNGESFVSNAVGPAQMFFSLVFTYPSFPQPLSLPSGRMDLEVWKNVMITLMKENDTFATHTYNLLVPEPAGPQYEFPDFGPFYSTPKPKFYIFEEDDVSLLIGTNHWMDFAKRLEDGNNGGIGGNAPTVIKVTGDHQGMLTRPQAIAQGILQAAMATSV